MDKKEFGQYVGKKREQLKYSQAELAKYVGVSRPYIAQIEGGKLPSDEILTKLIIALKIPPQEFVATYGGDEITEQERDLLNVLGPVYDLLIKHLDTEQYIEVMTAMKPVEEFQFALLGALNDRPVVTGPEGWAELSKKDQDLVKKIVKRLHIDQNDSEVKGE